MNDLQSSLFETMKQFSDYTKASSDAATTFQGTIKEVEDAGAGKYLVEYLGNNIKCYSPNGVSYLVGDNVYVLVPNSDFTKDKIILGLIDPREKKNYVQESEDIIYYEISNNFIDNSTIPEQIEMNSYETTKSANIPITTYTDVTPKLINDFLKNDHRIFAFSFLAKTNLPQEQRSSGNYGVTLSLPLKVKSADGGGVIKLEWKNFTLDVSNMKGDPYHLETWTPQTLYFTIDDQYEFALDEVPAISYFCSDFIQGEKEPTYKDIFIKSLGFHAVDALSISESESLSLTIKASEGIYFTTHSATSKTLMPYLRINGKTTEIGKSSEIYWFVEDISVKADSPYYCSHGGLGWKCLNDRINVTQNEDGTETFDWITTNKSITVNKNNVFTSSKYKCVVIYNGNKISKVITIQNLASDHEIQLESSSPDNVFVKNTGYAHLIAKVRIDNVTNSEDNKDSIFCTWVRYDKNGTMMTGEEEETALEVVKTNEIVSEVVETDPGVFVTKYYYATEARFPLYLIGDFSTFYCSVTYLHDDGYGALIEDHVGTESILISTSEDFEYKVVIDNDNIIYKYDVHGTSPTQTRNYDGPDSSKVTSIAPLTYRVYKADGEELSNEEYCYVHYKWLMPKNSLFRIKSGHTYQEDDNYYYIEGYDNYQHSISFYYDIKSKFDLQYAKNPIILELEINGSKLRQTVDINFIKEGGNGSNGTIYSAIITFNDMPYGAINNNGITEKLKFVYNISNSTLYRHDCDNNELLEWAGGNKESLGLKVYRDSDQLSSTDYTVKWEMFDTSTTIPCLQIDNNGLLALRSGTSITLNNDYCNIVRATVTVNDSNGNYSLANRNQIIYVYYPIEITLMSQISSLDTTVIPSMDGGYGEVIYRSDGTDPQYDSSSKLFTINDNSILNSELLEFKDYFTITWDSQYHLSRKAISSIEVEVTADNKYDNGNSKNYIKATLAFDGTKEANLRTLRGNQATELQRAYDKKTALYTDEMILHTFGDNFYIGQWLDKVNHNINELLNCTTRVRQSLEALNSRIEEFRRFMTSNQYSYSSAITLKDFYRISGLEGRVGSLFNDVYAALNKVVKLNNTNDLDNLIVIINNIYFVDRIEWQGDWTRTIRDDIGGPTLANTAIAYYGQMDFQISECYNCIESVKNIIRDQLNQGTYQDIKDQYNVALAYLTSTDARYIKLKANLAYYYRCFDTITSIREFRKLLNRAYNCTSNIFKINNSGSLSLRQNVLDEYTRDMAECDRIMLSTTTNIADIDRILNVAGYTIKHLRPIVLHLNTYEMSNINGWDGNKIEISEDDGYLLGVQLGAGKKENDNSFTGIIIGQRNIKPSGTYEAQLGLFGYHYGTQSIFLNAANGSAIFGKAYESGSASQCGQIIIDPTSKKALLYSSDFWKSYSTSGDKYGLPTSYSSSNYWKNEQGIGRGMLIDLSTPQIIFGNGNFSVSSTGILSAKGALIEGNIVAGGIGDWHVVNGKIQSQNNNAPGVILEANTSSIKLGQASGVIYSGDHNSLYPNPPKPGFYLGHDGLSIGSNFVIASDGVATINKDGSNIGNGAVKIENGSSTIGNWKIKKDSNGNVLGIISKNGDGIFMDSSTSTIVLGSSYGKIYSGNHTTFRSNDDGFYLSNEGLSIGSKFDVDQYGNLSATNVNLTGAITATSGSIGNVTISDGALTNGYFTLDAYGQLTASNADISGKITASTGSISGFIIDYVYIYKDFIESDDSNPWDIGKGVGLSGTYQHANICFWAGADHKNIGGAPFKVFSDGTISAYQLSLETHVDGVYSGGIPANVRAYIKVDDWFLSGSSFAYTESPNAENYGFGICADNSRTITIDGRDLHPALWIGHGTNKIASSPFIVCSNGLMTFSGGYIIADENGRMAGWTYKTDPSTGERTPVQTWAIDSSTGRMAAVAYDVIPNPL